MGTNRNARLRLRYTDLGAGAPAVRTSVMVTSSLWVSLMRLFSFFGFVVLVVTEPLVKLLQFLLGDGLDVLAIDEVRAHLGRETGLVLRHHLLLKVRRRLKEPECYHQRVIRGSILWIDRQLQDRTHRPYQ